LPTRALTLFGSFPFSALTSLPPFLAPCSSRPTIYSYYFIDRSQGIGAIVTTQFFPWGTKEMLDLRDEVERWAVENNPKRVA
jgi:hypothetical protein